jgi:hypothetical protein
MRMRLSALLDVLQCELATHFEVVGSDEGLAGVSLIMQHWPLYDSASYRLTYEPVIMSTSCRNVTHIYASLVFIRSDLQSSPIVHFGQ